MLNLYAITLKNTTMPPISNKVTNKDYLHLFILFLYFSIPYIPQLGSYDVVGPQWLAISTLNFIILTYAFIRKYPLGDIINNYLFAIILLFLIWGAYTLSFTINLSEGIIVFSRLINTFAAAIIIALLLKNRTHLAPVFSFMMTLFLIGESIYVFNRFFASPQTLNIDTLIFNIKANSGNKNIFAAAIIFKIPFTLHIYIRKQNWLKYLAIVSFFMGASSLFILNTRSTFISLFLILFGIMLYTFYTNKIKGIIILCTSILSLLLTNFFLEHRVGNSNQELTTYGTTLSRVKTININQSGRKEIWLDGLYAINKNPFKGCGIGNWKILSATKTYGNDMYKSDWLVPYHVHNDFIEMCIELGLFGGFLFILIFILLFYLFIRKLRGSKTQESSSFALFLLLCFICYGVDSMLNFPLERPVMQLNLAYLLAMGLCYSPLSFRSKFPVKITYLLIIIIVIPTTLIAKKHYHLLTLQNMIFESNSNGSILPIEIIDQAATTKKPFPNLSSTTVPFDAMIASEYAKNNQMEKALQLLERSKNDNPLLGYNECIKSYIFLKVNKNDSARHYIRQAWEKRPWASDVYKNALLLAVKDNDLTAANNYFQQYKKFRNIPSTYLTYFKARWNIGGKIEAKYYTQAKEILNKFPSEPESLELLNFIKYNQEVTLPSGQKLTYPEIEKAAYLAFNAKNYSKALEYFTIAYSIDSTQYTHLENIGLLYFNLRKFNQAEFHFKKAISTGQSQNGKSEFYLGLTFLEKNKKDDACQSFTTAQQKGYSLATEQIKLYCIK
jgi:O-antigen ligase/Tfp pilus assembly protein PilF